MKRNDRTQLVMNESWVEGGGRGLIGVGRGVGWCLVGRCLGDESFTGKVETTFYATFHISFPSQS